MKDENLIQDYFPLSCITEKIMAGSNETNESKGWSYRPIIEAIQGSLSSEMKVLQMDC